MDQIKHAPPAVTEGVSLPTRIELERPQSGLPLMPSAPISGSGWTLSPAPVTAVAIYLGPDLLCHAATGIARPEVAERHWYYPVSENAGFSFSATLPMQLQPAHATMRVVVVTALETHERSYAMTIGVLPPAPVWAAARTALHVARPAVASEAMLVRVEEARFTAGRMLRVRGWSVSLSPIDEILISLGGRVLGRAQAGMARGDVANALPDYPNAETSGFLFQQLVDDGVPAGDLVVHVAAQGGIRREVALTINRPERMR